MARGQRKSIETKIQEKEQLIEALTIRLEKEQDDLNSLLQEQENEALLSLKDAIMKANLTIEEATNILNEKISA